ncbi:hypothetical protein [Gryllotalpicola ginsengisoli]|uniref:hypothetical protein n=1 Tax=Gryllotalpicola ginsengisoli TaxID=444608 RepID=UPI001B7F9FCC|nr:hypothetical protein [Gryllotalpicola ginsengisoli]
MLGIDGDRQALEARRWTEAAAEVKDKALEAGADGVEAAKRVGNEAVGVALRVGNDTAGRARSAASRLSTGIAERALRRRDGDQDDD